MLKFLKNILTTTSFPEDISWQIPVEQDVSGSAIPPTQKEPGKGEEDIKTQTPSSDSISFQTRLKKMETRIKII